MWKKTKNKQKKKYQKIRPKARQANKTKHITHTGSMLFSFWPALTLGSRCTFCYAAKMDIPAVNSNFQKLMVPQPGTNFL